MKTETHFIYILILLAIFLSLWPILRIIRFDYWQRGPIAEKKAKTARPLRPKTPDDCAICRIDKTSPAKETQTRQPPRPWSEIRNRRGRKKGISTQGHVCNKRECIYFHLEESIHALVGYGCHGKNERIQDLMCQACGKKFTVRRDTVLYRLKSHLQKVALTLALLAEGMDVSALERVTGIKEGTLRTWLTRAGMHAEKLHNRFFQELIYGHIQLDELHPALRALAVWANFDHQGKEMWLWVATEARSKLIPVIEMRSRTLDMAMGVVHTLVETMRPSCLPVFTTDRISYPHGL